MDEPGTVHLWSLREDVVIERDGEDGELVLVGPWGRERITDAHPVLREALYRMQLGPVLLSNIEPTADSPVSRSSVYLVLLPALRRLSHLVVRTLGLVDLRGPLLSVYPVTRPALFALAGLPATGLVRLPQGVSLTLEARGFSLERVGSQHRVLLHHPEAVWVVAMLAWPVTPEAVSRALPLPGPVTRQILEYLAAAGMVVRAEEGDARGVDGRTTRFP
ncbi:NADH oxidase [Streptomyces sp. NPDC051041]|uniref:NADH oxidase n=1 Tax=Streptomyces sp. NPDC051041 TaxID=3365640 RepID=UPI0037B68866